jgi:hypothetical protein
MSFIIYGTRTGPKQPISRVHCSQKGEPDLADYTPLETCPSAKEARAMTAKWHLRFHIPCDLPEKELYVNPSKLRRYLGDEEILRDSKAANDAFWERHFARPNILDAVLQAAQGKRGEWDGIAGPINDIHYGQDVGEYEGYKIPASDPPFYSRLVQMIDHSLCGMYGMRHSKADEMTLPEGFMPELPHRTWRDFAKAHESEVRWSPLPDDGEEDDDFEY